MRLLQSFLVLLLSIGFPSVGQANTRPPGGQPAQAQATPAFRNGLVFLATERYQLAELCFEHVVRKYPGSYEGWAFLGQARLLQYADGFSTDDLRVYQLGQLAMDGFRRRHASLEPEIRFQCRRTWWRAYESLHEAVRQRPSLVAGRLYLGLAHLIHPDGPEIKEAIAQFERALTVATKTEKIDPNLHASLFINLGIAHLAGGNRKACSEQLDRAAKLLEAQTSTDWDRLQNCILYTRILLLSTEKEQSPNETLALIEKYLQRACSRSTWWALAWDRYTKLCKKLDRPMLSQEAIQLAWKQGHPKPPTVEGPTDGTGLVGKRLTLAFQKLGSSVGTTILPGRNLERYRIGDHSVEVIATESVLLVSLSDDKTGLSVVPRGSAKPVAVRINSTFHAVTKRLGANYLLTQLEDGTVRYRYYPEIGIAFRFVEGRVAEILLVETTWPTPARRAESNE